MNKILMIAFVSVVALASATNASAKDLRPHSRIHGAYCYKGWYGDGSQPGDDVYLTDRPMLAAGRVIDEASSTKQMARGTRFVEALFTINGRRAGWVLEYNNSGFLKQRRADVLECARQMGGKLPAYVESTRFVKR